MPADTTSGVRVVVPEPAGDLGQPGERGVRVGVRRRHRHHPAQVEPVGGSDGGRQLGHVGGRRAAAAVVARARRGGRPGPAP